MGRVWGSATREYRQHLMSGLEWACLLLSLPELAPRPKAIDLDISIAGIFPATILNVSFLSSLTTESSVASSPVHTFSSHLNLPSSHPFCLSVLDSSSFSGLPWTWRISFCRISFLFWCLDSQLYWKNSWDRPSPWPGSDYTVKVCPLGWPHKF